MAGWGCVGTQGRHPVHSHPQAAPTASEPTGSTGTGCPLPLPPHPFAYSAAYGGNGIHLTLTTVWEGKGVPWGAEGWGHGALGGARAHGLLWQG